MALKVNSRGPEPYFTGAVATGPKMNLKNLIRIYSGDTVPTRPPPPREQGQNKRTENMDQRDKGLLRNKMELFELRTWSCRKIEPGALTWYIIHYR